MPNRSKAGAAKKWKLQAAILEDNTGEIRCSFWNRDIDLRDLEGHTIIIKSGEERGLTTTDYENRNDGSVTRQLVVEKEATVDEVVGETQPPASKTSKGKPEPAGTQRIKVYESEEVKRQSIERQEALKQAVIIAGDGAATADIIDIAGKFYAFLSARTPATQPAKLPEPASEPAEDGQVL